jgi:hypothetical protein
LVDRLRPVVLSFIKGDWERKMTSYHIVAAALRVPSARLLVMNTISDTQNRSVGTGEPKVLLPLSMACVKVFGG